MRSRFGVVLALFMTLSITAAGRPTPTAAQLTPADTADVILETARMFEADGRWDVAEALYRLLLERYATTTAAAQARDRLLRPPAEVVFGDGTVELTVWMTLYGAALGVAIPGMLGVDAVETYGAGLLVGAPTGFLAGRSIARSLNLTEGQARAMTLGGSWGAWQGWGWREVFDWGVEESCERTGTGEEYCYELEESVEEDLAAMVIGSLTGLAAGAMLSGRDITPGTATAANFGSLWGTWFGLAGGVITGLEDDDLLVATLLGGDLALLATALMAPDWNVTRGRARLVSIAGVLGGLTGAGFDLLLQPDDEKVAVAIPLVGSIAGLLIGIATTRESDSTLVEAANDGTLLRLDEGRLRLGIPTPVPTLVATDGPGGQRWRTALGMELFRARF